MRDHTSRQALQSILHHCTFSVLIGTWVILFSRAGLVEELLKIPVVRVAGLGWSSWETWSSCSQSCSKGYRTRRRTCSGPEGKSAPVACRGSPVEYQDCNVQACPGEWMWTTCGFGSLKATQRKDISKQWRNKDVKCLNDTSTVDLVPVEYHLQKRRLFVGFKVHKISIRRPKLKTSIVSCFFLNLTKSTNQAMSLSKNEHTGL